MAYKVSGNLQDPMSITVLNSDGITQKTQNFSAGAWEIDNLICPSGTIVGFTADDTFKGFGNVPFIQYDSRPLIPWTDTFLPEVNRNRWLDSTTGYYPYIFNDKLRMEADSTRVRTAMVSKYFISGDFDVEVSFNIIYGPNTDGWHIYFRPYFPCASTNVNWNDDTSVQVRRSYISTGHKYYFEGYNGVAYSNVVSASDTSGKLRLTRSGSVITGYYWNGSSWTSISNQDYGTNLSGYPVYFLIGHETAVNYPTLVVDYTNFKVNSGTLQYRFDERFNYARSATIYSNYHTPNMDVYKAISSVPLIPYVYYNKLRFELDYTQQAKGLELKEKLVGNFDVQVDLDIMSGPAGDNWQFKMFAYYDANNSIRIGRSYVTGDTHCVRTETTVGGVSNTYTVGFTSISPTLRIKRIGTTVYTYYKDRGAGTWTLHRTTNSFPTGEITLRLYGSIAGIMTYNHAIADFDNLVINCVSGVNTKLLIDIPSSAPTTIPDPNTSLLLHFDESPLIDSSFNKFPITINGSMTRSATQSKFGGYSGYFDGTDDKIVFPLLQDLDFGTGNFTIDFWMRSANNSGALGIFSTQINGVNQWWQNSTSNFIIHFASTEQVNTLYLSHTNIANYQVPIPGVLTNTWYHIAFVRNGNTLRSYKNGVLSSSLDVTGKSFGTSTLNAGIGSQCSYAYYNGYLDEFRISKGIARWTSDFTPPTSAYSS